MPPGSLPMNGRDTNLSLLVGKEPPFGKDLVVSWEIKERATIHLDDNIGEDDQKTDKTRDGWSISLEIRVTDTALIDALEAQQVLREARLAFEPIGIQLQLNPRPGPVKAYLFTNIVTQETLSGKARKDRLTYKLECEAQRRELVR